MERIEFTVNGNLCSVGPEIDINVTLNDYLRKHLNLRGTKYMCREGGCGACVVSVAAPDPLTDQKKTFSVNSCLPLIKSCKDWDITTIEDIGNRQKGYHPIQEAMANYNASQCGYCFQGWVMAMYREDGILNLKREFKHDNDASYFNFSLMKGKITLTEADIENAFGGHICRCTGYRPILDALKSFASDNVNKRQNSILDIEDLIGTCKSKCKLNNNAEEDWCFVNECDLKNILEIKDKDKRKWFKVNEVENIFKILDKEGYNSYTLIAGNTGKGAYPIEDNWKTFIDINAVKELKGFNVDQNLIIGAGNTLVEFVEILKTVSSEEYFDYLAKFEEHMKFVAHTSVKNIATIGGNLMLKHKNNEFPSDIFLLLETVGAIITIRSKNVVNEYYLQEFLKVDMKGKVIVNVKLPPLNKENKIVTYKIMPRSQNVIAIVNAGFRYILKNNNIVEKATIVFGGISPKFVHAKKTEILLIGKNIFDNSILQQALHVLQNELLFFRLGTNDYSIKSRIKISLGLFYKSLIQFCPPVILSDIYKSTAQNLKATRPISHGTQIYETDEAIWPLNKPITKIEGLIQCAGEAKYIDDIPTIPREVFAAFVLSTVASGEIETIDAENALAIKGVIAFYTAKDIPGKNSFTPINNYSIYLEEEVLSSGRIRFYNQPIGIIVPETEKLANESAKMVNITYRNVTQPVLTIREAMSFENRITLFKSIPAKQKGLDIKKKIIGSKNIFSQCVLSLETQICVTQPNDDGIDVRSSTQWMDIVQLAISRALNLPQNRVSLTMPHVGGGFGGKVTRQAQVAVGCSLVTYKLNRPCRFIVPMTTVMRAMGNRFPCSADYEVNVNGTGVIQSINLDVYEDHGYAINESIPEVGLPVLGNCYDTDKWNINIYNVLTDTVKKSWARSPGGRISYEMSQDPLNTRLNNLSNDNNILEVMNILKSEANYEERRGSVLEFNKNNKWKKRGLRFVPIKWPIRLLAKLNITLSIYHGDGSVTVTHGGIEMGQGINTKVAQVCAYSLNIPLEKVKVERSGVLYNPNSDNTAGSVTSEAACFGTIKCCKIILDRLKPVKESSGAVDWEVLIKTADSQGVNLFSNYLVTPKDQKIYSIYGATMCEVEVDILTGEIVILRVDLLEDIGRSLSPQIDVGQLEGAFVMGLGYWTCENLVYDKKGELLTDRPWNFFVPLAKDIPVDFRIYFRKKSFNHDGVLGSKATGEPPICMSVCVAFAIREAIAAARLDKGIPLTEWFDMDGPCTNENIINSVDANIEVFKFF